MQNNSYRLQDNLNKLNREPTNVINVLDLEKLKE